MAQLDPNIILQAAKMPDGIVENYQRANEMNYKRGKDEAAQARSNKFQSLISNIPQGVDRRQYLTQQGFGEEALGLDKSEAEVNKLQAEGGVKSQEHVLKQMEASGKMMQELAARPDLSKPVMKQTADEYYKRGWISPKIYQSAMSTLQTLPDDPNALREHLVGQVQSLMSAKDQMGQISPDANARLSSQTQAAGQGITQQNNLANQDMARQNLSFNQDKFGQEFSFNRGKENFNQALQTGKFGLDQQKLGLEKQKQDLATTPKLNQGAIDSIDTAIDSLKTIIGHPGRESATGVMSVIPSFPGGKAAGFDARLETFKAQTFIPMVAQLKGMGALSDAEGKKLTAAVGALDTKMGDAEFLSSANDILKELELKKRRALGDMSPRDTSGSSPQRPQGVSDERWNAYLQAIGQ